MRARRFANLRELREKLLGYQRDAVSRLGNIPLDRLRDIEEGRDAPTVSELETLSALYGLAPEMLAEEPIALQLGDGIEVIASLDEFREISDVTKSRIVAVSNAAVDLADLRRRIGVSAEPFKWTLPPHRTAETRPWAVGKHYAERLRARLRLGDQPIRSVRDLVRDEFPEVSVLHTHLGDGGLAGLTFADRKRGLVIVLNLDGKNTNPCVRRFSIAHELCHLLVDWNRKEPLATLSGFLSEKALEREQCANSFAVRLLCPEKVVRSLAKRHGPAKALEFLTRDYGVHLEAARLYLQNAADTQIPQEDVPLLGISAITAQWEGAEVPRDVSEFPLEGVPAERRTIVANLASQLYSRGDLLRDHYARLLGVSPAQDLEKVLYRFGLDTPLASEARQRCNS